MASKIKVDNIENQCGGAVVTKCGATTTISGSVVKADDIQAADGGNIINQCGTTITLGASGDTVTLASGASQTGFGRTGTVDWDTTPKTTSFTAVSGDGYFVNTTSGAITVNLPASPSAGDIVAVSDYAGTAATNNITIARNGSNINGSAADITISKNNSAITLVYVDATQGWKGTETSNLNDIEAQPEYIVACGGTETTCGDFKIHTFTGPGTFTVSCAGNPLGSETVDYLVVAGGAGGGASRGGGGGGGGYRESSGTASGCYSVSPLGACVSALPVAVQGYPITVGGGGSGGTPPSAVGGTGVNSTFSTITSAGGGGGGASPATPAQDGGSGGGQRSNFNPGLGPVGGAGNTPPVSPPQGNTGGKGFDGFSVSTNGGGGGGATAVGADSACRVGGNGGTGATSSITGSSVGRAGGGGGGTDGGASTFQAGGAPGLGGSATQGGGAGNPNLPSATPSGTAGTVNTGGGGGGGGTSTGANGGAGGSGIVIIRYKFQ